jgi:predicted AlkP superfamily phosphohydrolase/phosphomutase
MMAEPSKGKVSRRSFLKRSAIVAAGGAAAIGAGSYWLGSRSGASRSAGKKVIVIGIDGMDPVLCERMMNERDARGRPLLPNLARLRETGGFSRLGTSIPPQSPVAWANFINGAGPGSHGIFDFIHRHPEEQCSRPFYAAAETVAGGGTMLRRQGVPFWEHLDAAGVPTTFYDLPCNYPPSPSGHGHHRCLCGMGTPDMLGSYGTYQYFADDGPEQTTTEPGGGGKRSRLVFEGETARAHIEGPENPFLDEPRQTEVEFLVHRDRQANAAMIEVEGRRILLRAGEWSPWTRLTLLSRPWHTLSRRYTLSPTSTGICRFYLQQVSPHFRLYVSPVNFDPSNPATQISEPDSFVRDLSGQLGLFPTAGFQEDYQARKNGVFTDDEYIRQAGQVLDERLALLDVALQDYDDGLLYFYFSSSDLQSHILWWDSDDPQPARPEAGRARSNFAHIHRLYRRLDRVIGDLVNRYESQATILVMSDHGFANFGRQFNLNTWLRQNEYLGPADCSSIMHDVDWSQTRAYGLGINGLYLNMKGRERDGVVEPREREQLLQELVSKLEEVRDEDGTGERVIRNVYRADRVYAGSATALAPDLIVGYARGFRASWATCLGDLTEQILLDNDMAWSADHCADALEVPGVLFSSRPLRKRGPALVDVAPSILAEFGLPTPTDMVGTNIF